MSKQVKTIIHHCDDCKFMEYHTNEWGGNHHFGCYHEKVLGREIVNVYKVKAEEGIKIPKFCPLQDVKCPIENREKK
jgi:hypothetical protein